MYIYSRVAYSYLNQFSNRVKLMRKVLLVPAKMRVSPCLLPGEVKWFIGGSKGKKLNNFCQFWVMIYHSYSLQFLCVFQGTKYFSIIKMGRITQSEELVIWKSQNRQIGLKRRQISTLRLRKFRHFVWSNDV